MASKAKTVAEYMKELPDDRRKTVQAIRDVILKNLDKGFVEVMQYGGIWYSVPHSVYPDGYHCDPKQPLPFCGIANQKNHVSVHMLCLYMDKPRSEAFAADWKKTGKRLDMGAGCLRVKKLEDVPLAVLGKAIKQYKMKEYIAQYEKMVPASKRKKK